MQVVRIINLNGLSVYLMETNITDTHLAYSSLTESERNKLASISHSDKKIEFLVSRHLRTEIFGKKQILYTETGAPYIDDHAFISLSHTKGLVGIACSQDFKVGLDLECIREKAVKLSKRFIHKNEEGKFDTSSNYEMSFLWSAKETLYKLAGRKGILFSEELWIEKAADHYHGYIEQPDGREQFTITLNEYKGKLITCNTSAGKKVL